MQSARVFNYILYTTPNENDSVMDLEGFRRKVLYEHFLRYYFPMEGLRKNTKTSGVPKTSLLKYAAGRPETTRRRSVSIVFIKELFVCLFSYFMMLYQLLVLKIRHGLVDE
jgi:hypothetical protein